MADARLGNARPFEAGLSAPTPYSENIGAFGTPVHLGTEYGDTSKQSVEIDQMGDPIAEPVQTPVRRV